MAASEPELRIAPDLALPLDAVTETFLIFGKRGSGKTTTSVALTEEMIGAGLPVCVLDPMGAWWGLRSSADGNGPGLPVTILGGEHADLPLSPDGGTAVADLLVAERLPLVLDMFSMSKTQQRTFVTDFMERLFRKNRDPLHLVIDEADRFAPQRGSHEGARLLGAYEDIVLRGRKPGIGSTSITLRPAQLHSAIRSQVEVLIAMRLLGKLDVQAIDEWVRLHATEEEAQAVKASLPSLPVGTAWFWSPAWLEILARVEVRPRRTFDSSATPKVGQQRIVPREFARVDPADLERMAGLLGGDTSAEDAPAAAARGDVAQLRRQVLGLTRQLAAAQERPPERIEVPAFTDRDIAALEAAMAGLNDAARIVASALSVAPFISQPDLPAAAARVPAPDDAWPVTKPDADGWPVPADPPAGGGAEAPKLKAGARNMLAQLARHYPLKLTRAQLASLAGIKGSGSTFSSYFSSLRISGFVAAEGSLVLITPEGLAAAGVSAAAAPPTAEEIRERWRRVLKLGARTMLDHLLDRYPGRLTRSELAALSAINPAGSTLSSYLSTLRTNGLIEETPDGIRAADVFFLGATDD
jgi:hypothetical protein